ncbi:hypothetical protein LTEGF4_02600 [Limnohabitans sp. TEGF004]|nr:hypothetical protein LTEGF4_02600 [Limnohabitans sp. TEGF004]
MTALTINCLDINKIYIEMIANIKAKFSDLHLLCSKISTTKKQIKVSDNEFNNPCSEGIPKSKYVLSLF